MRGRRGKGRTGRTRLHINKRTTQACSEGLKTPGSSEIIETTWIEKGRRVKWCLGEGEGENGTHLVKESADRQSDNTSVLGGFENPRNHRENRNDTVGKNPVAQLVFERGGGEERDAPRERRHVSTNGQRDRVRRVLKPPKPHRNENQHG